MKKRILALILALAMVFGMNTVAFAAAAPYTDVSVNWYKNEVQWAYEEGLMIGTSTTTFSPDMTATRAMMVTTMWRWEGSPEPGAENPFIDVPDNKYYTDAVAWAAENAIVEGVGNDAQGNPMFNPVEPITREQMVTMFYRFAKYKGYDITTEGDLSTFGDAKSVSSWAKEAMIWAVERKIIIGVGNNILDPLNCGTRAHLAVILYRLNKLVIEPGESGGSGGGYTPTPTPTPSYTDYIGNSVKATLTDLATYANIDFAWSNSKNGDTRAEAMSMTVDLENAMNTIVELAAEIAIAYISEDDMPDKNEVVDIVEGVVDDLKAQVEVMNFTLDVETISDDVYDWIVETGHTLSDNFYNNGTCVADDVTVSVGNVDVTFTFDENGVNYDGDDWAAAEDLAEAIAKDLYESLKDHEEYTNEIVLATTITFTFTDTDDYANDTENFPHVYPLTLSLVVKADEMLQYKYDNVYDVNYVKLTSALSDMIDEDELVEFFDAEIAEYVDDSADAQKLLEEWLGYDAGTKWDDVDNVAKGYAVLLARTESMREMQEDVLPDEDLRNYVINLYTYKMTGNEMYGDAAKEDKDAFIGNLTLGGLAKSLKDKEFQDYIADMDGNDVVNGLTDLIDLIPDEAEVTFRDVTCEKADLAKVQDAETIQEVFDALADLILNNETMKAVSIEDFEDGETAVATYDGESLAICLVIEI